MHVIELALILYDHYIKRKLKQFGLFVHCRTDSEIFEDAVELQQFFIRIRDELCKNGEILMSPALSYTSKHLHSDVEKEKKEKLPKEFEEDKIKREEEKQGMLLNVCCIYSKLYFLLHCLSIYCDVVLPFML